MKQLIGSALLIASALAVAPASAHPGDRSAACAEGAASCAQGASARGPQAMMRAGAMGHGMGMGRGMRQHVAMNDRQDCPMARQGAEKSGGEHQH